MYKKRKKAYNLNNMEDLIFTSPTKGKMALFDVVEDIVRYLEEAPDKNYLLVIGSDSQQYPEGVDFVSSIVAHRIGNGGRYFWTKMRKPKIKTLRDRIYQEAIFSITLAQELKERLRDRLQLLTLEEIMEIHVDVGYKGKTKEMIKEIVGMVRGTGFIVKTKPDSYGASSVADKYT